MNITGEDDMPYKIRFQGCGSTSVCARSRAHALIVAKDLQQRGRTHIVISGPDGTVLTSPPAPPGETALNA
ncbi:MAG: hypothetical protein AB7E05_01625 [Sphingobium sp.]